MGTRWAFDSMSDEFSASVVDTSKWEIQHFDASWKNNEKQCYVPGNVKVENGKLILRSTERLYFDWRCGVQQYFSGSVEAKTRFLHGTMEIRAKLPSGDGLWPAIWLLGDTSSKRWPGCGEIDLMEVANKDPLGSKATLHYGTRYSINKHFGNTPSVPLKEDYHTWKIIRTSDIIVMMFDDVEFGRKTRDQLRGTEANWETMFDAPMNLILNIAVGGGFTGIGNRRPNMATWDKSTMEIDYVRTCNDVTIPDAPPQTEAECLTTVACSGGTCASCSSRIEWLMNNRDMSSNEARTQVAVEFPDECNCESNVQSAPSVVHLESNSFNSPPNEASPTQEVQASGNSKSLVFFLGVIGVSVCLIIATVMYCSRSKTDLMTNCDKEFDDVEVDCEVRGKSTSVDLEYNL